MVDLEVDDACDKEGSLARQIVLRRLLTQLCNPDPGPPRTRPPGRRTDLYNEIADLTHVITRP